MVNPTVKSPREDTDQSLRTERTKSDEELDRHLGTTEKVADAVIEQARHDADTVLRAARVAAEPSPDPSQQQVRGVEDAAIERQRAAADVKLEGERGERTRQLAALFALERETTDQHLRAERARADVALTHRDDFLGMVAHDLRGFMGAIAFRSAILGRDAADDAAGARVREAAVAIQRSTAGMKRLVADLLDMAAIEAGRLHVEVAEGDLAALLRVAAGPFRDAAQAKKLSLAVEVPEGPVRAHYDHDRVLQVLGNLVGNAIKFTPEGGSLTLRLAVSGGEARLTVADSGQGIAADKLEAVFERFTQLQSDRRGLGLGLYIARCLVEAQRGRIWAESADRKGSGFTFSLPLLSAPSSTGLI